MRLLNTTTLEFETDPDGDYGILSHRWEGEEVTYQDMLSGRAPGMSGHRKIAQTCRIASECNLTHVWIDSCCIDKRSSSELGEAINSMWRWYRDATVCFAYLSDVDGPCPELRDGDVLSLSDPNPGIDPVVSAQFSASRWFTRGWTLQELLAPRNVLFYNNAWEYFGSKQSLIFTLQTITGIDPLALQDRDALHSMTVAKKFSWAAKRTTKFVEDRTYSLLGIFGVQMPMMYGEGKNAFIRLQEEIIRTSTDLSIFAWEPPPGRRAKAEMDLLFAASPEQFRGCGGVVPYHEEAVDSTFRLNNRGIEFEKLCLIGQYGQWALLNCKVEHDLRGPLALRLVKEDDLTRRAEGRGAMIAADEMWAGRSAWNGAWSHWTFNDRVVIKDYGSLGAHRNPDQKVTLLRHHPTFLAKSSYSAPKKFPIVWLRKGAGDDDLIKFELLEGSPPVLWRRETATMIPLTYIGMPDEITAWAKLRLSLGSERKPAIIAVHVALPESKEFAENGEPDMSGFRFVAIDASGLDPVAKALEMLAAATSSKTTSFAIDSRNIVATAYLQRHLGDTVFKIEMMDTTNK